MFICTPGAEHGSKLMRAADKRNATVHTCHPECRRPGGAPDRVAGVSRTFADRPRVRHVQINLPACNAVQFSRTQRRSRSRQVTHAGKLQPSLHGQCDGQPSRIRIWLEHFNHLGIASHIPHNRNTGLGNSDRAQLRPALCKPLPRVCDWTVWCQRIVGGRTHPSFVVEECGCRSLR